MFFKLFTKVNIKVYLASENMLNSRKKNATDS